MDDPYAVLGLTREASTDEVAAAWKRLAKEWHPDLRGEANALGRMVELNAAYEQVLAERAGALTRGNGRAARTGEPRAPGRRPAASAPRRGSGWWLAPPVRRALGPELLRALTEREAVREVVRCHTGGSAALLVLTERRLLWLLDDLVLGRVRTLALGAVERVERPRPRPWRRGIALRVRGGGMGATFAGLTADTADRLAGAIAPAS